MHTFLTTNGNGITRAHSDGDGAWSVAFLLEGQDVQCLGVNPRNPNVVYAGTQGQGVLRSVDRGCTWRPAGLAGHMVKALAVSPHQPHTIYAGTKPPALFVSRDEGVTWTELAGFRRARRWYWASPAEPPSLTPYVRGLAVSPHDPDVLVAGIEAGAVLRSGDGGQTWTGHCRGADRDCHTLLFHNSNGQWVYEGGGGGPAVSRDGGHTWRKVLDGLRGRYCWATAADPERPEVWYVSASPTFSFRHFTPLAHVDGAANAAIYRSSAGAGWEKLSGGLPQPLDYMAYGLATDPHAPGHLYAGLANGEVWHSTNYGDNWRKLPFNMGRILFNMVLLA